uniref:Contactin 3a, tandem duplicate 1 n=1 Tax=Astyanax mexicanus TaxID=7994 RepID=A0A8B9HCJ7_ASTMX
MGCLVESSVPLKPVFIKQPGSIVFPLHPNDPSREVTFSCEAQGYPPPSYRWKMNDTFISPWPGSRYRFSGGNLHISQLSKEEDVGIYQCLSSNSFGTILSREASLHIAYLEDFKTQRRSPVRVREGQGVVLLCGPPPHMGELTFTWIFNEYPSFVKQDNRRFVSQKTGNLYIAKVEPSDVGNYTCVVTNLVTKSRVQGPPTLLVLRSDGIMGEYEPKIEVQFPEALSVAKGLTVKLECFALGNPVPAISWRRVDGAPFPRKVDVSRASSVLEIPYFQQEDAGQYECVAENSRGRNMVKGKLSFYAPPHLLERPQDTQKAIDDSLVWECKASGKPKPSYKWLKNGDPLEAFEDRMQVVNGALSISSLTLSDTGMYQCVAENRYGRVFANAELKVNAVAPDFSDSVLKAQTLARQGGDVLIECRPRMSPRGMISWRKGKEALRESHRYQSCFMSFRPHIMQRKQVHIYSFKSSEINIWWNNPGFQSQFSCILACSPPPVLHTAFGKLYFTPAPSRAPTKVTWNATSTKIILKWDQVKALENESDVMGYKVIYKQSRHNRQSVVETNRTSLELALPVHEEYIIQIKAVSEGGEGRSSTLITIPRIAGLCLYF